MSAPALRTITLGCKVNQYETEYVREGLLGIGYRDAGHEEGADLCIVNTCTVTNEGDSKSRQTIRRLARKNPESRIIVMGCYATRAPEEVAQLPNVVEVVTDKRELPDLLGRFGVVDVPHGISGFGNRQRAYVKVQDGCLLRCSYCIIPQVRPHMYSRPKEHIVAEVERLIDGGYREIVLTGVHLGHYGVDWNWNKPKHEWIRLAHLVQELAELPGEFRLRLSSIEATEVTRELLQTMADQPQKIAPHLHICLQSGSDRILRRMRRRWGVKRFIDRCQLAHDILDRPAITTDVIIGFPGETDEDFAQTCSTSEACGFSKIHIFPFSPRRGTPAADMTDQVHGNVKTERREALAEIEARLRQNYFQSLVGEKLTMLVEADSDSQADGMALGTACRYSPVAAELPTGSAGKLVEVIAQRATVDRIEAAV